MKNNKGLTLIELVIAIFVISIGVVGTFGVLQKIVVSTSLSSSKLVAAYLAQEGIEIVRNIRDTNWVEGEAWDNDISSAVISNYLIQFGFSISRTRLGFCCLLTIEPPVSDCYPSELHLLSQSCFHRPFSVLQF